MELNETNKLNDKKKKNRLCGKLIYSIRDLFMLTYVNSLLPIHNNILLVHINLPFHIGLKNLIKNQLYFLLIYEKDIIGHVNHFVLLDFFIYFYNFLKFPDIKNSNDCNTITKKVSDPSEFTFKDILNISENSKDFKIFDSNSKCIEVFDHFLNFNDEHIYINDKTKSMISSAIKKKDIIYYILMNLKGKYSELNLSINDCIKKNTTTAYDNSSLINVLIKMQKKKLYFIPIVKKDTKKYIDYFSANDFLALYCKSISEKWNINPDKEVTYFISLLRTKEKEMKEKQNNIPYSYSDLLNKNDLNISKSVLNFSENNEMIKYNKELTIKESLKKLFFSKINALIVLNESNNVKGFLTFRSLFNHLMHS
ncbi:hypothetical protein PGAL8A_00033950 [Plasmodium gallinaceum]|uniref:CBS domain-containing protein n=1 Tax=Plasmodium gallinaceum TaxID=5849 RepID=A0A1J1GZK3_PLAGA|nr:hypothetical protein PGAL8A_00033950 [Plasmodium gallinaceum]CRG97903.1 hypothetical protein PGAL8A_00033950 [Plasmodium gallinaceum]